MASTWAATASNQLITWDALRDAVSNDLLNSKVAYTSMPTGDNIVTKADVQQYIWINENASPWSTYTSTRCPVKFSFSRGQWCILIAISPSDLLVSTGNTSYPDNTVYFVYSVDGTNYTESFTIADTYTRCGLPAVDIPASNYSYYYANDVIQYFTVSTIHFYPSPLSSCGVDGCVTGDYTVLYNSSSPCSGGTSTTIKVTTTPSWVIGTVITDTSGGNVAAGYYSYAGKSYNVQVVVYALYGSKGFEGYYDSSVVTSVTDC